MTTRRTLLASLGLSALGVTAGAGLAGCSTAGPTGGEPTGGAGKTTRPTYVGYSGVTPALPGDPELGIPNGFHDYPASPAKLFPNPLPRTEPITVLSQGAAPPVALDNSPRFKALCALVGNDMQVALTISTEYTAKFQTILAGSDIPDLVQIISAPELPKLLDSKFTDLGEFIGGDLVKEYPGLASIPSTAWSVPMLNGRLWGVPQARPPAGTIMSTRGDLLSKKGVDKNQSPKDGAELLAFFTEITDPKSPMFAIGNEPSSWMLNILLEMTDAPNGWQESGGKFTHAWETPNYVAAIEHCKKFWDAKVFHPNAFAEPGSSSNWWQGGVTQVYTQAFTNWLYFTQRRPEFDMGRIDIPKWDGGGLAAKHASVPAYGAYAAISKQSSPERVKEILRVLDVLAAPYGTQEYLDVNYGILGTHYNITNKVPIAIGKAVVQEPSVMTYFGTQVLGDLTGPRELVDLEAAYLKQIMPHAKQDASAGLYSATNTSKGPAFARKAKDLVGEIIQGRAQIGAWEAMVKEWQGGIGKAIRSEYEEGFAAKQ